MTDLVSQPPTLEDIRAEGVRLAEAARADSLPLKLMGGVAVWVRCPSARTGPLAREPLDIDFVSRTKLAQEIIGFFQREGYAPDKMFNALHGASRLNFADPVRGRAIDVILDRFAMCHTIDLEDRLATDELTIPLADLLVTKLQIVETNEKDIRDITAMLLDHPTEGLGPDDLDLGRLVVLTRDDWGLEHTIRRTMARVWAGAGELGLVDELTARVRSRIEEILEALDHSSKGLKWKLRARLGERVRWYELPEEVRRPTPPGAYSGGSS